MSVAIRGYIRGYWPLSVDFGDVSDVLKRTFVGPLAIIMGTTYCSPDQVLQKVKRVKKAKAHLFLIRGPIMSFYGLHAIVPKNGGKSILFRV